MEFIAFICIMLVLSWVFSKAGKACERWAQRLQAKEKQERQYKQALLDAANDVRRAVAPDQDPEPSGQEKLLRANQELLERRKVREAINKELDIQ